MIIIPNPNIVIARGGADELYRLPSRVTPPTNDWRDQDGLDVDLSKPVWQPDTRSITVHVSPQAQSSLATRLIESPGVEVRVYKDLPPLSMRYVELDEYTHRGGLVDLPARMATATLKLAMDKPDKLLEGIAPTPWRSPYGRTHVSLQGQDLQELGIVVHRCYSSALAPHGRKEVLTYSSSHSSTLKLPEKHKTYRKARPIEVECSIVGETITKRMESYAALWAVLSAPGSLSLTTARGTVECYYKSMPGMRLLRNRLSLTIQFQEI